MVFPETDGRGGLIIAYRGGSYELIKDTQINIYCRYASIKKFNCDLNRIIIDKQREYALMENNNSKSDGRSLKKVKIFFFNLDYNKKKNRMIVTNITLSTYHM